MINLIVFGVLFILFIIFLYILRSNMHKIIKPKMRKFVFIIYLGLLFLFTAIFFFVQPKITTMDERVESPPFLYEMIQYGNNNEELAPYKVNEWDIAVKDEQIRLQVSYTGPYNHMYIPVVVVEDETKDNEAHIVHYETPTILDGVDISSYVHLPSIEVGGSKVIANVDSEIYEHDFHSIQNTALLRQFEKSTKEDTFFHMDTGEVALVMTVPKGTTIIADVDQFDVIKK